MWHELLQRWLINPTFFSRFAEILTFKKVEVSLSIFYFSNEENFFELFHILPSIHKNEQK